MSVASTLDSVVSNPTIDGLSPNRRTARHFGCIVWGGSVNAKAGGTFLFVNPLYRATHSALQSGLNPRREH